MVQWPAHMHYTTSCKRALPATLARDKSYKHKQTPDIRFVAQAHLRLGKGPRRSGETRRLTDMLDDFTSQTDRPACGACAYASALSFVSLSGMGKGAVCTCVFLFVLLLCVSKKRPSMKMMMMMMMNSGNAPQRLEAFTAVYILVFRVCTCFCELGVEVGCAAGRHHGLFNGVGACPRSSAANRAVKPHSTMRNGPSPPRTCSSCVADFLTFDRRMKRNPQPHSESAGRASAPLTWT